LPKKIDKKQAMELLLASHPKTSVSILAAIDTCFQRFLPETALESADQMELFAYGAWDLILPARVQVLPVTAQVEMGSAGSFAPEPEIWPRSEESIVPEQKFTAKLPKEPKTHAAPAALIEQTGEEGEDFLATPAVKFSVPIPPKPKEQLRSKSLDELLGNIMRPTKVPARPITEAPMTPEKEEEPALSSASSEIMDKLRRQREHLANVVKFQEEEEVLEEEVSLGEGEIAAKPAPVAKPAIPLAPVHPSTQGTTFDSPKKWFDTKAWQAYTFTKFAFRLTPDEKKVKEYLVGAGEFARKTFVPRSGIMEMKVRLQMSEDRAIAMIWDWLKRGIIEEAAMGPREEEA
jgi:hypothetical protein